MPDDPRNPKATTALVLALCGIITVGITSVIAVPFAHIGLRRSRDSGVGRTKSIWAMVLGYIGTVFFALFVLITAIAVAVEDALDIEAEPTVSVRTTEARAVVIERATPATTRPQPPRRAMTLRGSGNAVEYVTLSNGRYAVEASVTGNTEFDMGTNFITSMYDPAGDLCGFGVNEIGATASGAEVINVGGGLFDCAPGEMAVEVMAAGRWQITLTPR